MQRFRRILVGVDLSSTGKPDASELAPPTRTAVDRALLLGEVLSARLTFFSSLDLSERAQEHLRESGTTRSIHQQAEQILAGLVERARAQGVDAESRVASGKAWLEITREVLREGHDLVLVGTRNLGAAGRLLLGSTGLKLVRKCPCPVWITRPDPTPREWNVLVASDLGEVGQEAIHLMVDAGRLLDVKLHVLHALEPDFDVPLWMTGLSEVRREELRRERRELAEHSLHEQLAQTDYRTLPFGVQAHVIDGPADVVILQAIDEFRIDLLVMGTHVRSGLPGLLIGNTAERVLPQVPCSVLVLKPPGFRSPVTLE